MKTKEPTKAQMTLLLTRLQPGTESCVRLCRRCRQLYFYLCVWAEYAREVNYNHQHKISAPRVRARSAVENMFMIDKKLFYKLRETIVFLAEEESHSGH